MNKKNVIWLYAGLILLLYGFAVGKHLIRHENNVTSLFYIGSHFARPPDVESLELYVYPDSKGYDGQFYLLIAMDPCFARGFAEFVHIPSYRYTRILLPFVSYALALGTLSLIPYTYVFANLVGFAVGCYFFLKIIRFYGGNDFYILPYAISLGMVVAVKRMLPDALAINLMVIAIYCHVLNKKRGFVLFASLSVLAKETMVLVPIAFFLSSIWQRKKLSSPSFAYLIPLLLFLAWQGVIHANLAPEPSAEKVEMVTAAVQENERTLTQSIPKVREYSWGLTLPFVGAARSMWLLVKILPTGFMELANVLIYVSLSAYCIYLLRHQTDPIQCSFAAYGLLVLCLAHDGVWVDVHSYSRVTLPLIVFSMIVFLRERRTVLQFPALVMLAEAFHILLGGRFPMCV